MLSQVRVHAPPADCGTLWPAVVELTIKLKEALQSENWKVHELRTTWPSKQRTLRSCLTLNSFAPLICSHLTGCLPSQSPHQVVICACVEGLQVRHDLLSAFWSTKEMDLSSICDAADAGPASDDEDSAKNTHQPPMARHTFNAADMVEVCPTFPWALLALCVCCLQSLFLAAKLVCLGLFMSGCGSQVGVQKVICFVTPVSGTVVLS